MVGWNHLPQDGPDFNVIDTAKYFTAATYDAMSRQVTEELPDGDHLRNVAGSITRHSFGKRLALHSVYLTPKGGTEHAIVAQIDYNEKGQRNKITYGSDVYTDYTYEPDTFRLHRLKTTNPKAPNADKTLQDLIYTYDPVGNITEIDDAATAHVFYGNAEVTGDQTFVYDALYRLTQATSRENIGQTSNTDQTFVPDLPAMGQDDAFRTYTQSYAYDRAGNFRQMKHVAGMNGFSNNWTRYYETDIATSNRLLSTSASGDEVGPSYVLKYVHDAAGNMTKMPHLAHNASQNCYWSDRNELLGTQLNDNGDAACYTYDAAGQRIRKYVATGQATRLERIYLGNYEILCSTSGGQPTERVLERHAEKKPNEPRRWAVPAGNLGEFDRRVRAVRTHPIR